MTNVNPLDALNDPTRRKLFESLRRGQKSVSELVSLVDVSQPAVSQHLRVLKAARLVRFEKHGQQRVYSIDPQGLMDLRAYVESLWEDVLGAYRGAAEQLAREEQMNDMQQSQLKIEPVVKSVTVPMEPEAAFRLFTQDIARWWPLRSHSVGGDDAVTCVLEAKVGGRFYEIRKDGEQDDWGEVRVWDPPRRVSFTMHPGRPKETEGDVEVTFAPAGEGTRVTLTHAGWERAGENAQKLRDGYASGWEFVLGEYVKGSRRG